MRWFGYVLSVLFVAGSVSPSLAQFPGTGEHWRAISSVGSVTVKKLPTTMHFSIQLNESGKDLAEALKALNDRRSVAVAELAKLGAAKESIQGGSPRLFVDPAAARAAMIGYPGGSPPTKKRKNAPPKVTVSTTVTAVWKLPPGGAEDLLLFVKPIQDKLAAADLAGLKEKKKLSPEEQEELDEAEMMQQRFMEAPTAAKPGEPSYAFSVSLSAEERQKAKTEAFQNARRDAEELAAAAGAKVGKLTSLTSSPDVQNHAMMVQSFRYGGLPDDSDANPLDDGDANGGLVRSPVLGKITFTVTVHAAFAIP